MVRVSSKNTPRPSAQVPYSNMAYWKANAGGGVLRRLDSPVLVAGMDALFKDKPPSPYGGREALHWHEGWVGSELSEPLPTHPGSSSSYEGGFPAGHRELFTTFSWDDQKVRRLFIRKVSTSSVLWARERAVRGLRPCAGTPGRTLASRCLQRAYPLSCQPSSWLLLVCASEVSPRALAPCPLGL